MIDTIAANGRAASPASTAAAGSGMLSLGLFGIPLGLGGLGAGWSAAATLLGAPSWIREVLYGTAGLLWLALTSAYLLQGLRRRGAFTADRRHPASGPFASLIPLVGIVLLTHYSGYLPSVGVWLVVASVAALAVVSVQILAHWVTGGVSMKSIHPGYFLPVVAGPFVSSIGFSALDAPQAALAAFGAGMFFWLVLGSVVTVRLMTAGELPAAAKPALSGYLAAPATANLAWLVAHPGPPGALQLGLLGILVVMVLLQFSLLAEYRKAPFSLAFWVFTFPAATTAHFGVRWFAGSDLPGREIYAWGLLALATVFILAIAVCSAASARRTGSAKRGTTDPVLTRPLQTGARR
jgi:tellurite resistance protein